MNAQIRITYETLFDLLRREKNREELQALEPDFYEQARIYLQEKEALLSGKEDTSYFSTEKEKLKIQYQNIRRLLKELYEKREKKIISIALVKARTGSDIIDTSAMLPNEAAYYRALVDLLSRSRTLILDQVINSKVGAFKSVETARQAFHDGNSEGELEAEPKLHFNKLMPHDSSLAATGKVKILEYLPRFMGRDGEVLGPFEAGAVVVVDAQIAGLLVKKGRAEPV